MKPPRALFIDYPLGFPLGEANNPELQKRIVRAALALLSREVHEPLIEVFAG
ncbi:MAG: hypothetical protein KIT09_35320 [Bryobacteraceae bacterium]|nr:hypothetical protein [Bryobacteraceae bacterium]